MPVTHEYVVDEEWETDLEPGSWYRIVDKVRPRIIHGYVFIPKRGEADYRYVDGSKLKVKAPETAGVKKAWQAAIGLFRERAVAP
jgi:hypothetical protein